MFGIADSLTLFLSFSLDLYYNRSSYEDDTRYPGTSAYPYEGVVGPARSGLQQPQQPARPYDSRLTAQQGYGGYADGNFCNKLFYRLRYCLKQPSVALLYYRSFTLFVNSFVFDAHYCLRKT